MKWIAASAALAIVAALALTSVVAASGVSGPAIYVDGELYRTVGTPTDFSNTGAPDHSFDVIYDFGLKEIHNVAEVAPGDPGYNGGRWQVHAISFNTDYATTAAAHDMNGSNDLDTAAEVEAALADLGPAGATDGGIVKYFECPLIEVPPKGKP